jgi:hypothetical protein
VNPDRQDSEIANALAAVGQANPPSSEVLENARELLWSAVAEEMLASVDAPMSSEEHKADQPQRADRKRRPNNSQQAQHRRNASPGA